MTEYLQMNLEPYVVKPIPCPCGESFSPELDRCPNCGRGKYKIFHEVGTIKMYRLFPASLFPERYKHD